MMGVILILQLIFNIVFIISFFTNNIILLFIIYGFGIFTSMILYDTNCDHKNHIIFSKILILFWPIAPILFIFYNIICDWGNE